MMAVGTGAASAPDVDGTHNLEAIEVMNAIGVMIGADCTVPTDIDDNRLEWVRQASIKYAETHK